MVFQGFRLQSGFVVILMLLLLPAAHADAEVKFNVLHYDLDVTISPQNREMKVTAKIELDNLGLDTLDFSLNEGMVVEEVFVDGEKTAFERHGTSLKIPVKDQGQHTLTAKIRNSGEKLMFGDLSVGKVGGPGEITFMVYRAAWYPMVLGDRATAEIRIAVPDGYTPITVGEHVGTIEVEGGNVYSWKTDVTVPGVSFAAGEFSKNTATTYITKENDVIAVGPSNPEVRHSNGGIQFVEINCYLTSRHKVLADNCISSSEKVLRYYALQFGGYPYTRFSVVEMPEKFFGGHGAMGLIMIHPSSLRGGSQELLAHEIAHNWWGALISVKKGYNLQALGSPNFRMGEGSWSNDLWLHEGMATYSSIIFLENARGEGSMQSSLRQKRSEYLKLGGRFSISSAEEEYTTGIYHATVYSKGALVIHMLRNVMGDGPFFGLLESYADKFGGTSVESKDFEGLAEEVHGGDLSWFFDEWIRGGGLPDYAVTDVTVREMNQGYATTVTISQASDVMKMPVDITLATAGGKLKKRVIVDESGAKVVFESWHKPHYVELDEEGWLLEGNRANNLKVLNYPFGPRGIMLLWRRLWTIGVLNAMKQFILP